jgi:RHS repeat-associated protein
LRASKLGALKRIKARGKERLAGTSYDANGNLLNDTFRAFTWNAVGRPVTIGSKNLTYDAFDRLVEKLDAGVYNQFVYSPSGQLLAKMSGQTVASVRVPLPGAWALYSSINTFNHYEHLDWLGSSRLSSNQSRAKVSDIAYGPFGEPYASTDTTGVSFTGMRGDITGISSTQTSGLYDFLAREYAPGQSRWPSPDPAGVAAVDSSDPQTWNRYAYLRNSPLNAVDPDGRDGWDEWGGGWDGGWGGWDGNFGESLGIPTGITFGGSISAPYNPCDFLPCGTTAGAGNDFVSGVSGSGTQDDPYTIHVDVAWPFGANNGPKEPSCARALYTTYFSLGLDILGAIPGLGNAVSATAAGAKVVNHLVGYGGAGYGLATGLPDEKPYAAASAAVGLGLTLADAALEGGKVIPISFSLLS